MNGSESGDALPAGWRTGTEGRLQFAFAVDGGDAHAASELVPGATVDVFVSGPGSDGLIDAASTDSTIATFEVDRACSCGAEVDGRYFIRSVTPSGRCEDTETKRCGNLVTGHAHAVGRTELVVLGEGGEMLDRTPVQVGDDAEE